MRWLWNRLNVWLVPEWEHLGSEPQDRHSAWHRIYSRFLRKGGWLFFVVASVVVIPLTQGVVFLATMAASQIPRTQTSVAAIVFVAVLLLLLCVALPLLLVKALVRFMRPCIRAELRELGINLCTKCGYNLTGNVSGRCPECGTAIEGPSDE